MINIWQKINQKSCLHRYTILIKAYQVLLFTNDSLDWPQELYEKLTKNPTKKLISDLPQLNGKK